MSPVAAIAAELLGQAIAYFGKHPDVALNLVRAVKNALSDANETKGLTEEQVVAKLTSIASGLAANRASAAQAIQRREAKAAGK